MAPPDQSMSLSNPLPDQRVPTQGDPLAGWAAGLVVAGLAFLLASFPARNPDVWLHLASGRQLAQWEAGPGAPLAVAPDPGVNHNWLYDLVTYGIFAWFDGPGLVIAKALLVAALAVVLLVLSRTGPGWFLPMVCTVLAVLAMGTRLLLQPATASYLLLGLALWFVRDGHGPDQELGRHANERQGRGSWSTWRREWLPPWPLMVLFVVWANLDGWFIVGLATVGLRWLGQVLDGANLSSMPPGRAALGARRFVQFAVLAALCLVNPVHIYALVPPPELGWFNAAGSWSGGPSEPVTSPLDYVAVFGYIPAGVAYFSLAILSLLSFGLILPRWHWRRFLPWLGLVALSLLQVRTVPFFAVVAGPVLAWNVQEFMARYPFLKPKASPLRRTAAGTAYFFTSVACLALLLCAWPGWLRIPLDRLLQGDGEEALKAGEPRQWAIETPPSLERGAAATRRWREKTRLDRSSRGLHLSRAAAYAFAWFCPEDRGLVDDGLAAAIRRDGPAPPDWQARMQEAGVNHVVVYAPQGTRHFEVLERLLADPNRWPLLYLEGDLAVFGWRGATPDGAADPFGQSALDLNRLAFHPAEDKLVPRTRAEEPAESRQWVDAFTTPLPRPSIDRDEARLYLLHAEAVKAAAPARHRTHWEAGQSAALVGAAGHWKGPVDLLDNRVRLALVQPLVPDPAFLSATLMGALGAPRGQGPWLVASTWLAAGTQGSAINSLPIVDRGAFLMRQAFVQQQDDTPPAVLYLAMRAARRALAADPDDAQSLLVLGECYWRLLHDTRERVWANQFPQLRQLRYSQASWAWNRAVAVKPDYGLAHRNLGGLYAEMKYLDLALYHLRREQECMSQRRAFRGKRDAGTRVDSEGLAALAETVSHLEKRHPSDTAGQRVYDQALAALSVGLAGRALGLLKESDIAAFGRPGMALELELLLRTGQAKDVYEWTNDPEQKEAQQKALGVETYHWLRVQAAAASGDYGPAADELTQLAARGRNSEGTSPREGLATLIGESFFHENVGLVCAIQLAWRARIRSELIKNAVKIGRDLREEANVRVLRGLLALEEGAVDEAETAFRLAVALWKNEAAAAGGAGIDFRSRAIAQACLQWLE
jgi:hypothetical protein